MPDVAGGERLAFFGALAIVADYVVFELILEEYYVGSVLLLAASLVVASVWLKANRPDTEWALPYAWLVRVLAMVTAYLGLLELFDDIRFDLLDNSTEVLAGIVIYVGAGLAFMGARQMKSEG